LGAKEPGLSRPFNLPLKCLRSRGGADYTFAAKSVQQPGLNLPGLPFIILLFHDRRNMSRIDQLREMLNSEPQDAFLNYALALELDKQGQHEESLSLFEKLMQFDPPYVPAFFMAGQMLSRLDRMAEARPLLSAGIEEARRQGNTHAAGEMSDFLAMLADE
jgi:tetratricopeptide (TPR) repeat protein